MPVDFVFSAVVLCSVVLHCIGLIMSGSVVMMIASFFPNRGGLCLPLVVILGYYRSALCLAYYYFDWVCIYDYCKRCLQCGIIYIAHFIFSLC